MIDCKTIAAEHKERLKRFIRENKIEVSLAVVQVGCDPASSSYIRGKSKDCDEVGIKFNHYHLPETVDTESVLSLIHTLNDDASVSGIIVQLPLPKQLDKAAIINAVSDKKDVDGFKSSSEFCISSILETSSFLCSTKMLFLSSAVSFPSLNKATYLISASI